MGETASWYGKIQNSAQIGSAHIAAAAGRPVVGLYAEKLKACEWYPYRTNFALVVSPSEESINFIEPEEIVEAAALLLQSEVVAVG